MYEIRRTERFSNWLDRLRDAKARARILARLDRVAEGNLGDSQPLGGIKSTQERDIRRAIEMARRLEE